MSVDDICRWLRQPERGKNHYVVEAIAPAWATFGFERFISDDRSVQGSSGRGKSVGLRSANKPLLVFLQFIGF